MCLLVCWFCGSAVSDRRGSRPPVPYGHRLALASPLDGSVTGQRGALSKVTFSAWLEVETGEDVLPRMCGAPAWPGSLRPLIAESQSRQRRGPPPASVTSVQILHADVTTAFPNVPLFGRDRNFQATLTVLEPSRSPRRRQVCSRKQT